jgi:septal ring factor EnvC (AmiA/AmiB activator)
MSGLKRALAVAVALAACLWCLPAAGQDVQRQLEDVQKDLRSKKTLLKQAARKEEQTLAELHRLNRDLAGLRKTLATYQVRLERTRSGVERLRREIEDLERRLAERRMWLARRLRTMHREGRLGGFAEALVVLGASEDFSQAVRRWRYLAILADHERAAIQGFVMDLAALTEKQMSLAALQARLMKEQKDVREAEARLKDERQRKEELLASVRERKADYQRMIKELTAAANQLSSAIRQSYDTSYGGKGFRRQRGLLPWPVQGTVAVPFGSQVDPRFKTPVFRNGIYIAAPEGSTVQAAHDGKVVYADWFKGYGQIVIVNHGGGYHTLYANLSEIFSRTGDIIGRNEAIGRVGSSGLLDRPSLYFEVRYKGKPLNPTQWLERRKR